MRAIKGATLCHLLGCGIALNIGGAALLPIASAQAREPRFTFSIAGGSLQDALLGYAALTGRQLLYESALVAGKQAPVLKGAFTADAALERLLQGSGLHVRAIGEDLFVIEPEQGGGGTRPEAGQAEDARTEAISSGLSDDQLGSPVSGMMNARPLARHYQDQDIVVTGSHIRGAGEGASPIRRIDRSDMRRNGYSTVAQALQALPGNFGGMATEQSALGFADAGGTNSSLATGVNLRGLGADATLVLVNGRRMAGSGTMGAFADVSSIPTGAVDHVEIMMDGASALYGSDAVGGVVNIILRQDYDGMESRFRLGSVTDGGSRNVQFDQTWGTRWGSGGLLLSYEFDRRTGLRSADRKYARSADSTALGGTDHRYYLSLPGNILGFNATTGSFGPAYAIPQGQDGTSLSSGDFLGNVINLEDFRYDTDLTPTQTRHGAYMALDQDLMAGVRFTLDARYSNRRFHTKTLGPSTIMTVTAANPWFVSPTGSSYDLIAYSFARELGGTRSSGKAEAMAFSSGLDIDLGRHWKFSGYGAFAQEGDHNLTHTINSYFLSEALGTVPDDPATSYSAVTDGYFNPYGTGSSNNQAVLAFIGSGYAKSYTRSRVYTINAQMDGPLFELPGGTVRMAFGTGFRREGFLADGETFRTSTSPVPDVPASYARSIMAGFAELNIPLFGAGNARPFLEGLDLSLAVRAEHYDDFGTTTNPKAGLRWVPVQGLALRATYGTSFRAPNLVQISAPERVGTTILTRADGVSVVTIQRSGGNADLRPERARSWTLGADLKPGMLPGLHLGATLFRTIFDRRIDQPVLADYYNALINPDYAPFVRLVSPATSAEDLAYVTPLLEASGSAYPVTAVGAVIDTRYVNTGETDVSGMDLSLGYGIDSGKNRFELGLNLSWLMRYRQRITPTAQAVDQRNLPGKPVDLRGRLTAGWQRDAWDALLGVNYVDSYHDLAGNPIASWTTFDLQLGYRPRVETGWLGHMAFSLVVQNLFDRDPPFYDSVVGLGYDAANADATGRYVSLQITGTW